MKFVAWFAGRPNAFLLLCGLVALAPSQAKAGVGDVFMTHYYDVATSTLPSASGYGGRACRVESVTVWCESSTATISRPSSGARYAR